MAEVVAQIDRPVADEAGHAYVVRICGRIAEDGLWEGWIEFDPQDGARTLRTPRETQQSSRSDLEYWATGLTVAYLEGALERARRTEAPDPSAYAVTPAVPTYDRPAPPTAERAAAAAPRVRPVAVLDPFTVYGQGEDVLRRELSALDEGHLRNIVRAYGLVQQNEVDLSALHRTALAEMIVAAVRRRLG